MKLNKWFFVLVLVISFIASCKGLPEKPEEKKNVFYYLTYTERGKSGDTITYKGTNLTIDTLDAFIGESPFFINKKAHLIRSFTSENHAGIDGAVIYFTLDNLGIIYSRSMTWYSSIRLHSNNDSINNLLTQALSHIILNPTLNNSNWSRDSTKKIKFSEPVEEH